jgi:ribosomal protein L11 methyltransferase
VTPKQWTSVRVRRPTDRAAVIAALFDSGAEGIQELDDAILTHIADADQDRILALVRRADASADVELAPTPDVDWSSAWRARIAAHRVGNLVVTPPWLAGQFSERERIVIEPAMAFGTGEHETTRGVLRLLPRVIRAGDVVADLGAGSAVLSIAAAQLGAGRVVGIELDPDAIGNAEENIAANGVADRVTMLEGDAGILLPLVAPVRIVLANIISAVLEQLLPTIASSLTGGGVAIVSGLLRDEREAFVSMLARNGWRTLEIDEEGIWWSAIIGRS